MKGCVHMTEKECRDRAIKAMEKVGLDPSDESALREAEKVIRFLDEDAARMRSDKRICIRDWDEYFRQKRMLKQNSLEERL